ncbi:hypothetical protein [Photorhabdus heterorhabditis]|uniref:hypothetical protein n=1 Tax=Photorhabdus heterorhabditis TaxID=880156 RepID=UPI00128D120F|nr:hypothetical protein [Photorhabdus heterorhabditis]NRN26966.1 hypothetical protein [Photorhabdus heterorhabditis subsp. aluminescens]
MAILQGERIFFDLIENRVASAISALRENGVIAKVLTEDNSAITVIICHDLGLDAKAILTT